VPNYECAVVLTGTLTDEQVPEQIETVRNWITAVGGNITDVDVWGRRRLAYPIRKQREGFYVIFYFTDPDGRSRLPDVERRFNTSETILTHMVVRLPILKEMPRVPREEEEPEEREGAAAPAAAEAPAEAAEAGAEEPEAAAAAEAPEAPEAGEVAEAPAGGEAEAAVELQEATPPEGGPEEQP